jgi:hypothetical protein
MMNKLRAFGARQEIRVRLVLATLTCIVLIYGLIAIFGRSLPDHAPNAPFVLRLHPERILAMIAAVLGMFRLIEDFRTGRDLIKPLLWILFASVIHLASIGIQLRWLSHGQG